MRYKWIVTTTLLILFGLLYTHSIIRSHEEQQPPLTGDWEFYWQQLLSPEDLDRIDVKPDYIPVPKAWGEYVISGRSLPSHGYATYRLEMKVPQEHVGKAKGLYLERIGSAYTLWIDGVLTLQLGTVGKSLE